MKTLEEVYRLCGQTGSWYGVEVTNFDQRNFLGDTVLHTVCSWGDVDAVKVLVSAGADVNAKGDIGGTPLFNAVTGRNLDVISFLLESGADPKITNDHKWQVLDYARNVSAPPEILRVLEKGGKSKRDKPRKR